MVNDILMLIPELEPLTFHRYQPTRVLMPHPVEVMISKIDEKQAFSKIMILRVAKIRQFPRQNIRVIRERGYGPFQLKPPSERALESASEYPYPTAYLYGYGRV